MLEVHDVTICLPLPTVRRLPMYLNILRTARRKGREHVSSSYIAERLGFEAIGVRKDLSALGVVGVARIGFPVGMLIEAIEHCLGWNNTRDAFVVGMGSLGTALAGYKAFEEHGLRIAAGFDVDPLKVDTEVHGVKVFGLERLEDLVARMHVRIGVLTVPAAVAQEVAEGLVEVGIRTLWNFTPVKLRLPEDVIVERVDLVSSLAVLSSRLSQRMREDSRERA